MVDPVRLGPVAPVAAHMPNSPDLGVATKQRASTAMSRATPLPQLLELVAELSTSGPPVDHARIAQVRRAIADGSYRIDPGALAKAIIRHESKE